MRKMKNQLLRSFFLICAFVFPLFVLSASAQPLDESGSKNKEERLNYLRDRWAKRLLRIDRVKLHTSLKPGKGRAIATVQIEGIDSTDVAKHLWDKYRIFVVAIKHLEFEGCRITPHVYTTIEEIDRFTDAMQAIVKNGVG